uniref:SCP domain-containing protein n=1 Tax=Glossina brevipalpis TaxID=37001 RepID=A0A1A9W4N4_9MUSC
MRYKVHNLRPKPCDDYKGVKLTESLKNMFVNTHNGLRNKVADHWNIGNMNLVHWSRELEVMAQIYLHTCSFAMDPCLRIGTRRLRVNQNQVNSKHLTGRWPGYSVRTWYLELGYEVETFDDYVKVLERGKKRNFTQLIWPNLEFIGCSAA